MFSIPECHYIIDLIDIFSVISDYGTSSHMLRLSGLGCPLETDPPCSNHFRSWRHLDSLKVNDVPKLDRGKSQSRASSSKDSVISSVLCSALGRGFSKSANEEDCAS